MELSLLEPLCDKYVVNIDKSNNNLAGNIEHIYFPKITVPTANHTFEFKIIWADDSGKRGKIQCLSSFKYLTVRNDYEIFFDYADAKNVFDIVYDDCALSVFYKDRILVFDQGIRLVPFNDRSFTETEQTIFRLHTINYGDKIKILSKGEYNPVIYQSYQQINDIRDLFYYIMSEYENLPTLIYLELNGKINIPIDYYIQQTNWSILDKRVDISTLTLENRIIGGHWIEIEDIFGDESEWKKGISLTNVIPNPQNIKMLFTKLLNINTTEPVYYANNGAYIFSREQIGKRPRSYYSNIYTLLTKSQDAKTKKIVEISLERIFYH